MPPGNPPGSGNHGDHHGGAGGGGGGGKHNGGQHARAVRRAQIIGVALNGVQTALIQRGVDPATALRYAQVVLSRPGVRIGKNGIHYKGQTFDAASFAKSKLADFVTGVTAGKQNQAAIEGDPVYQAALAQLELEKQLNTAGLDDQRRRSVLDFGNGAYAGGDSLLAGQAEANPFSVERMLALRDQQNRQAVLQTAGRANTLFGGGVQSGMAEAARQNAAGVTDSTRQLTDVLAGLSQQGAAAGQVFDVNRANAMQEATQRLLSSGVLHAAHAPSLGIGKFHWWKPVKPAPGRGRPGPPKLPPHGPGMGGR